MCGIASAHFYIPTKSRTFISPSGDFILKTLLPEELQGDEPTIWKETNILLFKYNPTSLTYSVISSFKMKGDPSDVFLNKEGTRIVTIDQKGSLGRGEIVRIYDFKGNKLKAWTLKDVFQREKRVKSSQFSSGSWRGRVFWSGSNLSIDFPYNVDHENMVITHDLKSYRYVINVNELRMFVQSSGLKDTNKKPR